VLSIAASVEELARDTGVDVEAMEPRLETIRVRMFDARAKRPRPLCDDKVLASWNGLMIGAFARGAIVLGEPGLAKTAERAAAFVWRALAGDATEALRRRWRDGESTGAGQLDDHAFLARGFVELYEATLDPTWLERAVRLVERMIDAFWDDDAGGFYESPAGDASVRVRMKDAHDGAELAGNSVALELLASLGTLLGRPDWRARAARAASYFAARIAEHPPSMPVLLAALALVERGPRQVVIAGDPDAADTRALLAVVRSGFRPDERLLAVDAGERGARIAALAPWTAPHSAAAREERAVAFVCEDGACRLPTSDPRELEALLVEPRLAPR
jgi:uncharacterized protein YyaL (SSP411 family)